MTFNIHDPVHVTGAASLVSASTSITMFGFSVGELSVVVSALIAVATFVLHVWYTFRKDKRERELHAKRLAVVFVVEA